MEQLTAALAGASPPRIGVLLFVVFFGGLCLRYLAASQRLVEIGLTRRRRTLRAEYCAVALVALVVTVGAFGLLSWIEGKPSPSPAPGSTTIGPR